MEAVSYSLPESERAGEALEGSGDEHGDFSSFRSYIEGFRALNEALRSGSGDETQNWLTYSPEYLSEFT